MKLSVVVVHYDMRRELPRTLYSLSPGVQRGVTEDDYEIIVVDNGSSEPADVESLAAAYRNARFFTQPDATPSPAKAVNYGLGKACGALVGVFIDGARIASPGLLRAALDASRIGDWPVIGALGLHLGPKVQMQSCREGYNQDVEDRLLQSVGWEEDPYRLFAISSLAGSSSDGLFAPISETNSLFLRRDCWQALGGADERFASPGGGYVNLDLWRRAVEREGSDLIMLIGEATFHQVHGGIATNRANPPAAAWEEEYRAIRGESFARPQKEALYFGRATSLDLIERSVALRRIYDRRGGA